MLFLISEGMQFLTQFAKRRYEAVGVFGMIVLGYLAAFSNPMHNLDFQTYQFQFAIMPGQTPAQWKFEKGYSYLSVIFARLGTNYQTFRVCLCLLAIVVMYVGVRRFTGNTSLFVGVYGATVFLLDATQLRNFIMIAFVVLAISFLQQITVKNFFIALALIMISAQFHSLGYVFLIALLLRLLPFEWLYKNALWFVSLSIGAILAINLVGIRQILTLVAKLVGLVSSRANLAQKLTMQYGDGSVLIRYVAVAVSTIAAFLLVWFLYRIILTSQNHKLISKFQVLYQVVLLAIVLLPTLSFADDYSRIPRSIFLFVIIAVSLYFENVKAVHLTRMQGLVTFLIVLVCVMNGFSHLYMWGTAFRGSLRYLIQLKI